MESNVKLLGHPIHPVLVAFPVALFTIGVVFDLLGVLTGNADFHAVSFWTIGSGLLVGLGAAVFGLIDWLAIRSGTRAKRIGAWHGGGNVVMVLLFAASWWLRLGEPGNAPSGVSILLGVAGILIALVTAWLGGELVYRLRIGVDEIAGSNAPSSLERTGQARDARTESGRPARVS